MSKHKLKKIDASYLNLDDKLWGICVEYFRLIQEDFFSYKIQNNGKKDLIFIELLNGKHLPLYFTLCENEINCLIGRKQISYWEDFELENETDYQELKNGLKILLRTDIEEIIYKSGDVKFLDMKSKKKIASYKNLFSFIIPSKITYKKNYISWITS